MTHTEYAVRSLRPIAGVLVVAMLLWGAGFPSLMTSVNAANVTSFSDTLSDSAPSVVSNHTIQFTTPNGMLTGQTFTITFPAGFALGGVLVDDIDLATSTEQTLATSSAAGVWGVGVSGQVITFTTPTDYGVPSSTTMTIEIGLNATAGSGGNNQITNDTVGSKIIALGGSMADSGDTRVAIIDTVLVTASVETVFNFAINGVANTATVNNSPTTTATTTTSTTLPFETLVGATSKTLAQDLVITTNAAGGFAVTVEQDTNLESATTADIDGFIDGAYTDTPSPWVDPGANPLDEDTWGHWGLTSEDPDLFGNDLWVAASTTPRTVWSHNDVVNASTTRVGYQAQISGLQEAADDYSTVLTYIATPTF
jgi:hypothetical protein